MRQTPAARILRAICLTALSLAAPVAAEAQPRDQLPRLCFLTFDPGSLHARSPRFDPFFSALRDLGYVDGHNINIAYLSADGNNDRFPGLIDRCLALKPDVIAVSTTPAALFVKQATRTVPTVMIGLGDPVGTGLVDSLSRPSGNLTGTAAMVSELGVKRLELLKELAPGISQVLVLTFLADAIAPLQVKALEQAAGSLGVTLQVHGIQTADDISKAFDAGARDHAQAVVTTCESVFVVNRALMAELAAQYEIPAVYCSSQTVSEVGGLMSYTSRASDLQRPAASYVDRIFKGTNVAELPVQRPATFDFVINLRTAKALNLTIPPALLARATEVIE